MSKPIWDLSTDYASLFRSVVRAKLDDNRASRLFACACGRLIWDRLSDEVGRPSIEVSERFADGLAGWDELRVEHRGLEAVRMPYRGAPRLIHQFAIEVLMPFKYSSSGTLTAAHRVRAIAQESGGDLAGDIANRLRDIFQNPRQPEPFDPTWRTSEAVALARAIHDDRAFDRMPILGDALEEAGCPRAVILDHCRHASNHARGCWVVDSVLGWR